MSSLAPALIVILIFLFNGPTLLAAPQKDELADLTGQVQVTAILTFRDQFSNEFQYEVRVKNITGTPLVADSLLVVVDKITNITGRDRDELNREQILNRIEVLGTDGETAEGKPYFLIPPDGSEDLAPYSQSRPVTVRFRNPNYVTGLTPSFRILGKHRPPPEKDRDGEHISSSDSADQADRLKTLIQLLIKKGLLTPEEWSKATTPEKEPTR